TSAAEDLLPHQRRLSDRGGGPPAARPRRLLRQPPARPAAVQNRWPLPGPIAAQGGPAGCRRGHAGPGPAPGPLLPCPHAAGGRAVPRHRGRTQLIALATTKAVLA